MHLKYIFLHIKLLRLFFSKEQLVCCVLGLVSCPLVLALASVSVLGSHTLLALGLNPDCAWLTWLDAGLHLSSVFY